MQENFVTTDGRRLTQIKKLYKIFDVDFICVYLCESVVAFIISCALKNHL